MIRAISLFSGAVDGLSIAFRAAGAMVTHHVEIDPWCCTVLRKNNPRSIIIEDDIKNVSFPEGAADVIFGGPPCQGFSLAGSRQGFADERYLWPEMYRIISAVRPRAVLVENVRGSIAGRDNLADQVLSDLEGLGYAGAAFLVPACLFGAPHERYRVFVVAHANGARLAKRARFRENISEKCASSERSSNSNRRSHISQPGLGRGNDGPAPWLAFLGWPAGQGTFQYDYEPPRTQAKTSAETRQRIKALGNAVVWQQAYPFARAICEWIEMVNHA